jgi:hypothetical protein
MTRALLVLWLLVAALPCIAQDATPTERQVKAAFLYRFTDYVQWPESAFARPDAPLVIGVLGDNAMATELQTIASGRTVRGHPVAVKAYKEREPLTGAHVVFIAEPANAQLRALVRSVEGPVLVVTDSEDGLTAGGVINFVMVEGRIRFEVSLANAGARSLALGSGLLSVALNVRKGSMLPPPSVAFHTISDQRTGRRSAPDVKKRLQIL